MQAGTPTGWVPRGGTPSLLFIQPQGAHFLRKITKAARGRAEKTSAHGKNEAPGAKARPGGVFFSAIASQKVL